MDIAAIGIAFDTSGLNKGNSALRQTEQQANRTADAVDKTGSSAKRASESFLSFSNVLSGIGFGIVLREFIQLSDQYTKFTAQLKLATASQQEYNKASSEVQRIAKQTEGGIGAIGVLYARITNATRDLGTTQAQVSKIAETVGLSLKVAGASAQESASAMLQLSQAFGAGALRGEEFNAVNEAAPGLLRILAESMGVNQGALKKLAEDGKLTTDVLTRAFTDDRVLSGLREQAKEVRTISGAITLLKDQLVLFVGAQNESTGAGSALAGIIGTIAKNLDLLSAAALGYAATKVGAMFLNAASSAVSLANATIQGVAAANASRAASIAEAQAKVASTSATAALTAARVTELRAAVLATQGATALAVATNGLIPAQARAAAAAEAHALAVSNLARAQAVATGAAGLASKALGFLGGPIGAITTLLGLGVTAWLAWGGASKTANDQATQSTEASTRDILSSLDKQNEALQRRIDLAKAGNIEAAKSQSAEAVRLADTLKQINDLKARGTSLTNVERLSLIDLEGNYASLSAKLEKNADLQGKVAELGRQTGIQSLYAKYATDAEKLAKALEEARKAAGGVIPAELERRIRASFARPSRAGGAGVDMDADFRSYLNTLEQQIQRTQELTAVEKLRDDIRRGSLTLTGTQEKELMALAQRIDKEKELNDLIAFRRGLDIAKGDEVTKANEARAARLEQLLSGTASAQLKKSRSDIKFLTEEFNLFIKTSGKAGLSEAEYLEAVSTRLNLTAEGLKETKSLADDLGLTFTSAFEDAIVGGKGLRDVLNGLEADIIRIVTRKLVTEPLGNFLTDSLKGVFGGSGGGAGGILNSVFGSIFGGNSLGTATASLGLDSIFGGFFANGGRPAMNKVSVVGERGPELFVPDTAGRIIPNNMTQSGRQQTINYSPTFVVSAPPTRQSQEQIASMAFAGARKAFARQS